MTEERPIGILESSIRVIKDGDDPVSEKFNLHFLYSLYEGDLIAYCLDFSIYERISLKDAITGIENIDTKSTLAVSRLVINRANRQLVLSLIAHLEFIFENRYGTIARHAPEDKWKEYRTLRQDRDNYYLKKMFDYPDTEISPYLDVETELVAYLNRISPSDETQIRTSFDDIDLAFVNDFRTEIASIMESAA